MKDLFTGQERLDRARYIVRELTDHARQMILGLNTLDRVLTAMDQQIQKEAKDGKKGA